MISQILKPTAEFVMPTGTSSPQAIPETESQPLKAETKIRKCSE